MQRTREKEEEEEQEQRKKNHLSSMYQGAEKKYSGWDFRYSDREE